MFVTDYQKTVEAGLKMQSFSSSFRLFDSSLKNIIYAWSIFSTLKTITVYAFVCFGDAI